MERLRVIVAALLGGASLAGSIGGCQHTSSPTGRPPPAPSAIARGGNAMVARTPAEENAACERCHVQEANEWRGSKHRRAATDRDFVAGFAKEPLAWCVGCHAPEVAIPGAEPSAIARGESEVARGESEVAMGVGCVTCHLAERRNVHHGERRSGPSEVVAPRASTSTCTPCHEFPLPGSPGVLMQSTVTEHLRIGGGRDTCTTCHMPAVAGQTPPHADHRFAITDEAVRSAARISVSRTSRGLRVRFERRALGHAFPTGDVFRRIRIEVEAVVGDYAVLERKTRLLARQLPKRGGERDRLEVVDDRPFLASSDETVEVALDDPNHALAYRVTYERADSERVTPLRPDQVVELARGTLKGPEDP